MPTYRVAFDGAWQGRFAALAEAIEWADAVAETDRIVFVAKGPFRRLVATLPESRAEEGRRLWDARGGPLRPPGDGVADQHETPEMRGPRHWGEHGL
jgi:hypothetical protein